ncbi:hypothetical protein Dimus_022978 [Dionaea muscipula]
MRLQLRGNLGQERSSMMLRMRIRALRKNNKRLQAELHTVRLDDRERVIDEAAIEGESGSGEKFYDAEDENPGSPEEQQETPAATPHSSAQQQEQGTSGVDPSGPTSREAEFLKFQAEFERKRANRFHDDLEKAKAENARLLALLHQTQIKPHP